VTGGSDLIGDATFHAFLWTKDKGMQDLGTLRGDYSSYGTAINDWGLAVLLHRLWVSGEVYEPLHHAMSVPISGGCVAGRGGENTPQRFQAIGFGGQNRS
jgi:probable HAF family extracellular repeat protein